MSETKHTPGPWRVYPVGSCVPHYDVCPRVVSDHPSGRSVSDPISDADARLIAAAPAFGRLLREAADALATARDGDWIDAWAQEAEAELEKAGLR